MSGPDYWTVQAMKRYGGGFVRALADAAILADDDNLSRLKAAWPEYWLKYSDLSERLRLADEAGKRS